jgi:hypothetical protein
VSLATWVHGCGNKSPGLVFILKGKAIPAVAGRDGPWGCETSRLPHCLYSRLTNGGKVVSLTRRPPFTPQGHSAVGRIR